MHEIVSGTSELSHLRTSQFKPKMMLKSARAAEVARTDEAARAEAMVDFRPDVLLFSTAEMFRLEQE